MNESLIMYASSSNSDCGYPDCPFTEKINSRAELLANDIYARDSDPKNAELNDNVKASALGLGTAHLEAGTHHIQTAMAMQQRGEPRALCYKAVATGQHHKAIADRLRGIAYSDQSFAPRESSKKDSKPRETPGIAKPVTDKHWINNYEENFQLTHEGLLNGKLMGSVNKAAAETGLDRRTIVDDSLRSFHNNVIDFSNPRKLTFKPEFRTATNLNMLYLMHRAGSMISHITDPDRDAEHKKVTGLIPSLNHDYNATDVVAPGQRIPLGERTRFGTMDDPDNLHKAIKASLKMVGQSTKKPEQTNDGINRVQLTARKQTSWKNRYASAVCLDCGMQDSGGYQEVRGGKCVDQEVCESRQKYKAENPPAKKTPAKKAPVKNPRRKPIVNRNNEAKCWHPDCLAAGKRFPLSQLSFEFCTEGKSACQEHRLMIHKGVSYDAWKNEFRRR